MINYKKKIMILGVCTFLLSGCGSKEVISEITENSSK